MKNQAKLILRILLFSPILLLVVIVNWAVDPASLYTSKELSDELVSKITSGNMVTMPNNMDWDKIWVIKKYVDTLKKGPDVIVLGSSRSMMISPDLFPGKSFCNASIPAAGMENFILNYGFFRKKGFIPSTVVIGVDENIFDSFRSHRFKPWLAFKENYEYMLQQMSHKNALWTVNITDYIPPQYLELFSFGYFQQSLFALQQKISPPLLLDIQQKIRPSSRTDKFIITKKEYNKFLTILPGFVVTFAEADRKRPVDEVEEQVRQVEESSSNTLQRFPFDQERIELFEDFINLLKRDNINIILFLPPLHPESIGSVEKTPEFHSQLERIEDYLHLLANKKGIKIVGSYFNERAGIPASQFYDAHHLRTIDDVRGIFLSSGWPLVN